MTSIVFDSDLCFNTAMTLAKEAGNVIRTAIKKTKLVEFKSSPRDLVTESDKAVEDYLISNLKKDFPDHKFIGEESVAAGVKSELTDDPTWIIDPIDGTMNFVHAFPFTCVSIGLWVNKQPEIGIIYNPCVEHMFTARKGQGAFLNGEKITVSGQKDLAQSLVCVEMGTRPDPVKMRKVLNNVEKIVHNVQGIRSIGSAAIDQCFVAMGGLDAYYEIGIHAWDMAAGCLIVKEAGGVVMDVNGGPFDVLSRRILCASSQELADKIIPLLEIYEEERD